MPSPGRYDVVVVGASIAGCTTAIELARSGLTVALVERRPGLDAYKVSCTHFIQSSATPTIRRLGLARPIEAAGAVRDSFEMWTNGAWMRPPTDRVFGPGTALGYSVRRKTLDPLLRRLALATPGVELMLGERVTAARVDHDEVRVDVVGEAGRTRALRASLLVGADGRRSAVAGFAGLPARQSVNNRSIFWAYYHGLPLHSGTRTQFWNLDPDAATALPTDGGLTLLVAMPTARRLPEFEAGREEAFERFIRDLPDAPELEAAERVSPILGKRGVVNLRRSTTGDRIALVGDAAVACDPLPGVGCSWAFQSAEWLAEAVAPALREQREIAPALCAYAARHRSQTADHYAVIKRFSLARSIWYHRLLLEASTLDEELSARTAALLQRRIPVSRWLTPATVARAAAVVGRHRLEPGVGNVRNGATWLPCPLK